MRTLRMLICLVLTLAAPFAETLFGAAPLASVPAAAAPPARPQALPRYFEANRGQWPASESFRAYGYGYGVTLGKHGVTLQLASPHVVPEKGKLPSAPKATHSAPREISLRFEGVSDSAELSGLSELPAKGAWFAGDESNWHSNIPLYERVRLDHVYPGVDATFYGRDGQLEYDLDLEPGANTSSLVLDLEGADKAAISNNGDLTIEADGQQIVLHKPLAWQPDGQRRRAVDVTYALLTADAHHGQRVGMRLGKYDTAKPLIIDPVLTFATYLAVANNTAADAYIADLTTDSANNVYVLSQDASQTAMTIQKLTPAGSLVYTSTFQYKVTTAYYSNPLIPVQLRINSNGQAYVAAYAIGGYPTTTNAYQKSFPNASYNQYSYNGALSVLSADGSSLVYSTYFGGTANGNYVADYAKTIAIDAAGNAYLAGQAGGGNFPVTPGAYQSSYIGPSPAGFVAKFNPAASGAASLVYSTLLGGQYTSVNGIAVDSAGNAYVAAYDPYCANYPTTPGAFTYSGGLPGSYCGHVTALNPTGTGLVYSAYLGPGQPLAIAVDASQNAYVTGNYIQASDFASTPGAFQTTYPDGFALELNPTGGLVYGTYLGGPSSGAGGANLVNPSSIVLAPGCTSACTVYISGQTTATDLPLINALSGPASNNPQAFLTILNGTGTAALSQGYLGGETYGSNSSRVAADSLGNLWMAGTFTGNITPDFPVTTSVPSTLSPGGTVSWLAKISLANSGTVVAVPNALNFGNTVPVNVPSSTASATPTNIELRNLGSAPVTLSSIMATPSVFTESDDCGGQIAAAGNCTAQIVFTPGNDSAVSGTLTVTSNGVNSPLTIPLAGQGLDTSFLQLTPTSLSFGQQVVNTASAPQVVTVTNLGNEPYVYTSSLVASGPGFTSVSNCPANLPPSGSCQIQITFAPNSTQVGPQSGSLYSNYWGTIFGSLTGIGVLPSSAGGTLNLTSTATSLNFGTEAIGTASAAQSVYLTNSGTQTIYTLTPTVTLTSSQGSAADFQFSNFGGQSILPAAYISFNITFTPSSSGTETATLNIPIAGSSTPFTISLIGQGASVTQTLILQPDNWTFPDQVVGFPSAGETLYLANMGNTPLTITRVIGSGDFSISANYCDGRSLAAIPSPGYLPSGYGYCTVNVTFTPQQTGVRTGTLTVLSNNGTTAQTYPLSGNGIAATGTLFATPTSLAFGTQVKGTSSAVQYIAITNPGNNNINYTAASTTGDYAITYNNCAPPYVLTSAYPYCSVGVTFTPTVTTESDGTLTLNTSAGNQTFTLTGAGVAASLAAAVSPTSINYGSVQVNSASDVPVYVRNAGTQPLKFNGAASITGNYIVGSDNCGTYYSNTLAPGQSCSIDIYFQPTASGTRAGTLTVKTTAGNLTSTFTGVGTSTSAALPTYFTPAALSFDQQASGTISAPITATFYYNGTSPSFALNGASITAGSANFQLATGANAQNNCSANLGATTTCSVNVVFSPTAVGLQTGTLTINSSVGPFSIALTGYALSLADSAYLTPGTLTFAGQVVSTTSSSQPVYLVNTGSTAFTVGAVGGTNYGPTSEFQGALNSDTCSNSTLNSADSQNASAGSCYVYVQFAPSAAGARTGTLTFPVTYADGTTATFTAQLSGTGIAQLNKAVLSPPSVTLPDTVVTTVSAAYEYIYLTNSGNLPFNVGQLTGINAAVGSSAGEFTTKAGSGADYCSNTSVAANSSCYIAVDFAPTTVGARTGSINFPVTYANSNTPSIVTATFAGNGVAKNAALVLSPAAVQFGIATAGVVNPATNYRTITALNTGNVPITFSKATLSAGFIFNLETCNGNTLAPGASCTEYIQFSPAAATAGTTVTGTLSLTDNASGSPHTAALTGTSIAASAGLQFSQTTLDFGPQLTKTQSNLLTLYLVSGGSKAVKINSIALSGANKSDFTESDGCAGVTLQPYNNCTIYIYFTPGAAGARTATLTENDTTGGGPRTVTLIGTGIVAGSSVVVFPGSLSFGAGEIGQGSAQQFFSVTSTGANPVTVTSVVSSDGTQFPITQDGCTGQTVYPGSQCNVGVLFSPTSAGAKTATISVTDNATGSPHTVQVTGGGVAETGSTVSLAASPSSAPVGSLFTLTATVLDASSKPVTNGAVTFFDGTTALGTAQVVANAAGGAVPGTATLKTILVPLGTNTLTAQYVGGNANSTSAPATATVTGQYATTTTFATTGSAGNYTFTGTVQGAGPVAPTGSILFTDTTTGLQPGTATIDATTLKQSFVAAPIINNLNTPQQIAFADLNGDGIPDLVTGLISGISVQIGNGDGTFKAPVFYYQNSTYGLAFADFNRDGKLDIAVVGNAGVGIAFGNGDGTLAQNLTAYESGAIVYGVAVGDFNGDGILDIAAANINAAVQGVQQDTVDLLLGNGDGTFQQPASFVTSPGGYIANLTVGDFNGDGKLDVAMPNPSGNSISTLLGKGNGTFQPVKSSPVANSNPGQITSGDINGDGKLDIVTNDGDNAIGLMLGNGDGTFQAEQTVISGSSFSDPAVLGDLNGDGKIDLVIADYGRNAADVLFGNGDGTFQNLIPYPTGAYPSFVAIADLNHDGKLDFATNNYQGNSDTIYLSRVMQTAKLANTPVPGTGTHSVSGTYNGDTNFLASTSNTLQLTASLVTPAMQLAASPSSTVPWAQQLSVNVTLTGAYNWVPAPTGTATYSIDGGAAQTASVAGGAASIPIAQLSIGTHSIAVSYGGDQYYTTLTSQSLAVTIVKANQTITFAQLPNVTYGASPITLAATATSGLPVAYKVNSGPATIANGILTITGAGTVVVEADQSGNIDYNAAPAVPITFIVAKAPLTVIVNSASKVYGAALPTFSGTITGVLNGDAITAMYKSTGTATSPAGTYPINATLSGAAVANYTTTITQGTLTVSKAALTLTANALTGTYGSAIVPLTYSVAGLVNSDTAATAFTGLPALSTTATAKSPTGSYPITIAAGTLASNNYTFTLTGSSYIITKAVLTITPTNVSSTYGAALPALAYTLNGFVNGDTALTATTGAAALTTTATNTSGVGTYPITATVGTLAAANYSFSSTQGMLTITTASLTVTPASVSRLYGAANPVLTGTVTGAVSGDVLTVTYATTATPTSAVGSYPITAAVSGSNAANYTVNIAPAALTITPATLTVTGVQATSLYGATLPAFTYTIGGFVAGDSATTAVTGAAKLTTTATSKSPVGTYPISVAQGTLSAKNYTFTFVPGTLTITPATLTVKVANATAVYGAALPAFTYTITGFTNGDAAATAITGAPLLTSNATAGSKAGAYTITATAGTLTATNYKFTFVTGTLTISKAVLNVTATSVSSVYGAPLPALGYTIDGFVNGDTAGSATTGAAKATTLITPTTGVGPHTITIAIGTLASTNYSFKLFNGTITITQATLTVTVNSATRAYGAANPKFTGTVTGLISTDTVTVAYASAATTTSAAGTYPITATVSGPKALNYAVNVVPGTLTVSQIALKVTAANATSVYGATLPTFTYAISGFINGDSASTAVTGTPSLTTTATQQSPVGTYPITPATGSLTSTNYSFQFVAGTLTVTKAVVTVTANNLSSVYGATPPVLTNSWSGFVNNDTAATATTGAPALSTTATALSGVGSYPITAAAGTLAATNYSFAFVPGTLTITQAPLLVAATNFSQPYGTTASTLPYSITGFVNGDTAAKATTGAPSLVTTALATSPIGTYPITTSAGTLAAANYSFQFTNATLTVTKATLTVSANNLTKAYGAAVPALTYTVAGFANNETAATATTGVPKLTTTALANSVVGRYPITVALNTLAAKNYTFVLVSGTLTVTPATLTITVNSAKRAYGLANPAFTGTVTGKVAGDALTYTYSTTATKTSAVGTYPITATATGAKVANYTVNVVPGTLTITPAVLTVTASAVSKVYGAALPTFPYTYLGFLNGDTALTAVTGTPSLTTTATATSPAGTYPITAVAGTLAATNYTFKFVAGTLTITKAVLTVTPNSPTSVYGSVLPTLTYVLSGLAAGDTQATATTGAPSITTTATSKSPVGKYTITAAAGTLASTKYSFVYKTGTLTINKAVLTATADNQSIKKGAAIPTLTYTLSGFVNLDTQATATTGAAALSTTATAASPVGTYRITLTNGTLAATNYTFTDVNGTLTITQ